MVKPLPVTLVLFLLGFLSCPAAIGCPSKAAMIGTCVYYDYRLPGYDPVEVSIFGGFIRGTGWVSDLFSWSETRDGPRMIAGTVRNVGYCKSVIDAGDFVRPGQRISVYDLEAGVLGDVRVTMLSGAGRDGYIVTGRPVEPGDGKVRLKRVSSARKEGSDPEMLAVWEQDGSQPDWVTGKVLDPANALYRALVIGWLAKQGMPAAIADAVAIEQIVRADINSDGRDEVFLSFHSPETSALAREENGRQGFSYLVVRTIPKGNQQAVTIVVDSSPDRVHQVRGFCDLDRDGAAEVATQYEWGTALFRWDGGVFTQVGGEEPEEER